MSTPTPASRSRIMLSLASLLFVVLIVAASAAAPANAVVTDTALTTFETAHFTGSGTCADCHTNLVDESGSDVSIDTHWRSTMMANAAKDPLWQAAVNAEVARNPAERSAIEAKCAICHTPMAYAQATADGTPVALSRSGFGNPSNSLHEAAMDGISCTLCHQIENDNLGTPERFDGNVPLDLQLAPNRHAYGSYPQPAINPMRNWSGFTPEYGMHIADAALCATCHTLRLPVLDANGIEIGSFPEQMPYVEWLNSRYGDGSGGDDVSCQLCHTPPAQGAVTIANRPPWLAPREPFEQHFFVGGNTLVPAILRDNGEELGVTATTDQFNATLERARTSLEAQSAELDILSADIANDTLTVTVRVRNLVGHKLPTGIPLRRAWLHLTALSDDGGLLFESGGVRASGRIVGDDAFNGDTYEPHYDRITTPNQVQIYETVMVDTDGAVTTSLLAAAAYAKDNRLLPQGFDPQAAPSEVAVRGAAATDANFTGGQDVVVYEIALPPGVSTVSISAELRYQTLSFPMLLSLVQVQQPLTNRFLGYYIDAAYVPVTLAAAGTTASR